MSTEDYGNQLKKAFQELQQKMVETKKRLQVGEAVKRTQSQKVRFAELTKQNLEGLEKDRPVYRSVGRLFFKSTVDSEIARHAEEVREANEKISTVERQKEYLEKSLAESEKNLREMVQSRP